MKPDQCASPQAAEATDDIAHISGRLARLRRLVRCAEICLERALDEMDRISARGSTTAPAGRDRMPLGPRPLARPSAAATRFAVVAPSRATWVVRGAEHGLPLSPVRLELMRLLAADAASPDDLVGFKSAASLVAALREGGWDATRRSVTVEVGRLRTTLGFTHRALIETRRRVGYRFRVTRSSSLESE
jgi:DNA-binding response OmpR family regulator